MKIFGNQLNFSRLEELTGHFPMISLSSLYSSGRSWHRRRLAFSFPSPCLCRIMPDTLRLSLRCLQRAKQKKSTQEKWKVIPADTRLLLVCQKNLCFRYFCHHSCQLQVGILGVYRSPCQNNISRLIEREMKETTQKERLKFNCKTALFHFNVFSASWSEADTWLL